MVLSSKICCHAFSCLTVRTLLPYGAVMQSPKLSPSQLRRSRICCRLLQHEVVDRRTTFSLALELAKGLAAHEATNANMTNRITTGRYLPIRRIADAASDSFKVQSFLVDWRNEEEKPGEATDAVIRMSLAHARTIAQDVVPIAVEKKLDAFIPEIGATIGGRVDLIAMPLYAVFASGPFGERTTGAARQIRDTKTTKSAPPAPEDSDADQLVTYQLLATKMGLEDHDLMLDYLTPVGDGKAKPLRVTDAAERLPRLLDDYRDLIRMYETGLFPRTGRGSWRCRPAKCPHYDYCVLGPGRRDL
jgi:hypothetical protein